MSILAHLVPRMAWDRRWSPRLGANRALKVLGTGEHAAFANRSRLVVKPVERMGSGQEN